MNILRPFLAQAITGLALILSINVHAQQTDSAPANPVLKGAQVTESALIDALAIEPPEAASGATRGFRAAKRADGSAPKPGAGKASLLITFATNSAELTADSQNLLNTLAKALQSDALAGFSFKVEGHADARGDADANRKLSQLRAESVAQYLVKNYGLLPERLTPIGRGADEPMNKMRADAPENRRVTIVTSRN
jgi:OmpA-OmpF porin, OOP family